MSHFSIDRQPVINRGCSRCRASRVLDSAFFVPVVCVAFENDVMAIFGDADCASATSMTRSAASICSRLDFGLVRDPATPDTFLTLSSAAVFSKGQSTVPLM
ncbi:hypothetical protein AB8A28_05210 [Tardiphaga sp. 71_E8_N1_1]|uniref:hypothetical protein n=1 Tax=Tardiphaga sp. 71_E8_N1_1 TaxID=3240784 RepID=UPI003F8CDBF6